MSGSHSAPTTTTTTADEKKLPAVDAAVLRASLSSSERQSLGLPSRVPAPLRYDAFVEAAGWQEIRWRRVSLLERSVDSLEIERVAPIGDRSGGSVVTWRHDSASRLRGSATHDWSGDDLGAPDFVDRLVARYGAFRLLASVHPPIPAGEIAAHSPDLVWVCGDWVEFASRRAPHCSRLVPRTREFDHALTRCFRRAATAEATVATVQGLGPTLGDMRRLAGCADLVGIGYRHCFELYLPVGEQALAHRLPDLERRCKLQRPYCASCYATVCHCRSTALGDGDGGERKEQVYPGRKSLCERLPSAVVAHAFGHLAALAQAYAAQTCVAARRILRLPSASPAVLKLRGRPDHVTWSHLPAAGAVAANPRRLVVADVFADDGAALAYDREFGDLELWQTVARMPTLVEIDLRSLGWRAPRPVKTPFVATMKPQERDDVHRRAVAAACDSFSELGSLLPALTALHLNRLPVDVDASVSLASFSRLREFSASVLTCGQLTNLPAGSLTALAVRVAFVEERRGETPIHVDVKVALAALLALVARAPKLVALHLPTTGVAAALCEALVPDGGDRVATLNGGSDSSNSGTDADAKTVVDHGLAFARLRRLEAGGSSFGEATTNIATALDVPHVTLRGISVERVAQVLERETTRLVALTLDVDSAATPDAIRLRQYTREILSEATVPWPPFLSLPVRSRPALRELSLHARREICAYLLTQIVPGAPALATIRLAIRHWPPVIPLSPHRPTLSIGGGGGGGTPPCANSNKSASVGVSQQSVHTGGTAAEFASLAAAPHLETLEITLDRGDSSRIFLSDWLSPAAPLAALRHLALVSKSPATAWDFGDLDAVRVAPGLRRASVGGWVIGLSGSGSGCGAPHLAAIEVRVHDTRALVDTRTLADLLPALDTFLRLERLTLPSGLRGRLGVRDLEAIAVASDRLRARGVATEYA